MAKKLFAVLVICIVAVAALRGSEAEAVADSATDKFKKCFTDCEKECLPKGSGSTFCEVKCDEDCTAKEAADKLAALD